MDPARRPQTERDQQKTRLGNGRVAHQPAQVTLERGPDSRADHHQQACHAQGVHQVVGEAQEGITVQEAHGEQDGGLWQKPEQKADEIGRGFLHQHGNPGVKRKDREQEGKSQCQHGGGLDGQFHVTGAGFHAGQ